MHGWSKHFDKLMDVPEKRPTGQNLATLLLVGMICIPMVLPCITSAAENETSVQDLTTLPIEQLMTLEVLSASKLARQVSDAPSAVTVVTAQDIKDYGYRTLADILNSIRGLYITNDYSFDFPGGRGFSRPGDYAGRILLLIDGYASNDSIYNQIYIDNSGLLDTELIERVEYVPGTGSVLYGNNAYFGIISVTTKKGSDFNGTQVAVDAFSYGGKKGRATFGKQFANGADWLVSVSTLERDGQSRIFFPEFNSPATNNGIAENLDAEHSNRLFTKFHFENWQVEAAYVARRKAVPTGANDVPFNAYSLFRDTNGFVSGNYNVDLGPSLKSSTHAYTGYYLDHGIYAFAIGTERAFNRGQWWGVDQKLAYTGVSGHQLILGAEYRDDFKYRFSNILTTFDRSRQTFSVYGQDAITLNEKWLLNIGARYDKANDTGGDASPRVAVIYSPTSQTTLTAAYSTAFRLPAAIEKFNVADAQIDNPDLDSEQVTTIEFVLKHEFSSNVRFTGSLYRYKTSDLIRSVTLPSGNDQFQNGGETRTRGVELELEKIWPDDDIRLRTSYAYQDAEDVLGNTAINAPKNLGKLNLSFPILGRQARTGVEWQYTGARLTEARRKLGGYAVTNLTLTSDRVLPNVSASASLRNLFDKRFLTVAPDGLVQDTLEARGRTFWLQLTYDFK